MSAAITAIALGLATGHARELDRVGEGFHDVPGSHHRVSENASDREPASLLAVFVVDSKDVPLTIPDPK
jgi:hypothetical protein